jgi:hypothetical protein
VRRGTRLRPAKPGRFAALALVNHDRRVVAANENSAARQRCLRDVDFVVLLQTTDHSGAPVYIASGAWLWDLAVR